MLQSARFLGLARDFDGSLIHKITWPAPYDHKRDLPNFQSKYSRVIALGIKFSNSHYTGPSMTDEV